MRKENYLSDPPVRAAIYARYSSDMQRPASIEDQTRNCKACAEEKGWVVLPDFVRSDSALSGAALIGRDALNSHIADAKKRPRPFDCLLIDDSSRLGRNLGDVLKVSEIFKHHGVFLYFVSQELDSRDLCSRQLLIMNGWMDEQYLVGLADKVRRGQTGRILNGYLHGGRCYGYRNVPIEDPSRRGRYGRPAVVGVRQEIIEEEASIVRRIFDMYAQGESLVGIAKKLNKEGVPSPQRPRGRSPRAWCPSGIREILRNERYRGVVIYNRTTKARDPETGQKETRRRPESEWVRSDQPWLRIVTDEQWDAVRRQIRFINDRIGARALGGLNRTPTSRTYLFSRLLVCGRCSAGITIAGNRGPHRAYGCFAHRFRGTCTNAVLIRQDRLEQQLLDALVNRILRPEMMDDVLAGFQRQLQDRLAELEASARRTAAQSADLRAERQGLAKQVSNLVDAIARGEHQQSPALLSRLSSVEHQIESIDQRLNHPAEVDRPPISAEELRRFVSQRTGNLQQLLVGDRLLAKQVLRQHIRQLVLTPRDTPSGPVLDVSGDIDLFAGEPAVMLSNPSPGHQVLS